MATCANKKCGKQLAEGSELEHCPGCRATYLRWLGKSTGAAREYLKKLELREERMDTLIDFKSASLDQRREMHVLSMRRGTRAAHR